MKVVLYPLIFGVAGLLGAWLWTLTLPDTFTITKRMEFDVPLAALWKVYTDPATQASWRSTIARVEMVSRESPKSWREIPVHGPVLLFTERIVQEERLYTLHFQSEHKTSGFYKAEFTPDKRKTVGIFTERVTVSGALPKLLFQLFVDLSQEIETYGREAEAEARRRLSQESSLS